MPIPDKHFQAMKDQIQDALKAADPPEHMLTPRQRTEIVWLVAKAMFPRDETFSLIVEAMDPFLEDHP